MLGFESSMLLADLQRIQPPLNVIADVERLKPFETDAFISHHATPLCAVLPESESQVAAILKIYELSVKVTMAEYNLQEGQQLFRTVVKSVLHHPEKILICNFFGRVKGMSTGGHYSVVGAYDEETDSVLVMDTAAHKNPWYWVPVKHLYKAMHTKDGKHYRGWIVVSD